jgi:hypothetical protein
MSCNSKLLHKISHTFTMMFLKYTALSIAKNGSVTTTLKLLISTQCAAVNYGTLHIYLSLFTIAHTCVCCRKQQWPPLLERKIVVDMYNQPCKVWKYWRVRKTTAALKKLKINSHDSLCSYYCLSYSVCKTHAPYYIFQRY